MAKQDRCTKWTVTTVGSKRMIEKTCGVKTARVVRHPHWWTVTIRAFGSEVDRTSADSLKKAKRRATRLLTVGRR